MTTLVEVAGLAAKEHGLVVVSTARDDGTIQSALVNAGVIRQPGTHHRLRKDLSGRSGLLMDRMPIRPYREVAMTASLLRRGNLPGELTSFIGRRDELATARRLLGESRLVTLTGVGGVGKTRLALRLANQLERAFEDGIWLVDLATLSDAGLVAHRV